MGGPGERARARQLLEQAVLLKQQYAGAPGHPGAPVRLEQAGGWVTTPRVVDCCSDSQARMQRCLMLASHCHVFPPCRRAARAAAAG